MARIACLVIGLWATAAFGQAQPGAPGEDGPPEADRPTPQREPATPRSALHLLFSRVPAVEFDEAPLSDVFAELARIAGTNVVVRWSRLEELGIEREQPITLHVRNLRLSQILWLVMEQIAGDDAQLAYRADSDMILISTVEELGQPMIVKAYDVQDLIASRLRTAEIAIGRTHDVVTTVVPSVAAGAVAVRPVIGRFGSAVYLGGREPDRLNEDEEVDADPAEHLQNLVDVITTTIEPDSWAVNGGLGTISAFRGTLVIRNSPLVHQKIGGYLSKAMNP